MKNKSKIGKWIKAVSLIMIIAAFIFIAYYLIKRFLPGFIPVVEHGDADEIENYIRSLSSTAGVLLTGLLQFFQIISIFLPGMPIQIAAGIIFGGFFGFVICQVSYILANITVFLTMRKLGNSVSDLMPGEKEQSKFSFITNAEYPEFTVFFGCLMPILANGIVPYIAARTKISTKNFILSMTLGSFPTIFLQCAIGSKILSGDYIFAGILLGVVLVIMVLTYIFRNKVIIFVNKLESKDRHSKKV